MPPISLTDKERAMMLGMATAALQHAYAPYSKFRVGATVITDDGHLYTGSNVENASYGLTSCAERNAVFAAVGAGQVDFEAIAIHADAASAPPCGACRQVMTEFAPELRVIWRSDSEVVSAPLSQLLPERFVL